MNVVKWITGISPVRCKSLVPSTIITLAIVAMLILSGPAQAVAVLISGQDSYSKDRDLEFQVTIELNENDKYVPLTNISLDLTGNVSRRAVFDLNGKWISGNCGIEMKPVSVPDSNDFGYGYGYDSGYGYKFGYGYGYGYGYGGGGGNINFIYNVTIEPACLPEGHYTVVATLNTDQKIFFQSAPFRFVLEPAGTLKADVEIKPETLGRSEVIMGNEETTLLHCPIDFSLCLPKIFREPLAQEDMDINRIQQEVIGKRLEIHWSPVEDGDVCV